MSRGGDPREGMATTVLGGVGGAWGSGGVTSLSPTMSSKRPVTRITSSAVEEGGANSFSSSQMLSTGPNAARSRRVRCSNAVGGSNDRRSDAPRKHPLPVQNISSCIWHETHMTSAARVRTCHARALLLKANASCHQVSTSHLPKVHSCPPRRTPAPRRGPYLPPAGRLRP